jgi:hypothetical protein
LRQNFLYRGDERDKVNLSIKIPPPCSELRFPVLAGVRWGDVSFS